MNQDKYLKTEDIITDYYSTIGKFQNVTLLINNKEYYTFNPSDDKETKLLKESRKREILVDLGRVGELAFKYIIKLKQLELYPNQSYEQFKKEALFTKGAIKNLANKMKLSEEEVSPLINYQDINRQEKHNFHYLFLIIEKLIPEIFNKFNQTITYNLQSKYYKEYNEEDYNEGVIFPFLSPLDIYGHEKDIKEIQLVRENAIKHSGDIFTRLRYFSNNPKDKEFDVEEIYEIIKDMITFIQMIHNNNDNLNLDVEKEYAKIKIKENIDIIPKTKEEISKLFTIEKIKNNVEAQQLVLFYSENYTLKEIEELFNSPLIKPDDYIDIFCHSLKLEAIKYFKEKNINEYIDMANELEKPLKINFSTTNTLEEYKKLRKYLEMGNYNRFKLTNYLSINSINKLNNYPKLLDFLLNSFYPNENSINFTKSFSYEDEIFNEILSVPNIEDKCEIFYGLDIDQMNFFNYVIRLIKNNPKYKEQKPETVSLKKLKENIIKNYEFIKDNSLFKDIYPLFLNPINNQKNIKLLLSYGMNKTITKLDSTILCIPYYINEEIFKKMEQNGLNIFVNTDINYEYYNYLDKILIDSRGISHRKIIKRGRQDYFKLKKIESGELDIQLENITSAFEKRLKLFIEDKLNKLDKKS